MQTTILSGIVGSLAYGLETPESDIDTRGIFVADTSDILGLEKHKDVMNSTQPDICMYEIKKFMQLALAGNPNILELLYLPSYEVCTHTGYRLINRRHLFLSNRIRITYGGYAKSQLDRLIKRGDGSFSADTRKRKSKHSRHLFRLLNQGRQLLTTGTLTVKVSNREELFAVGELPDDELVEKFNKEIDIFNNCISVLPENPDSEAINEFLLELRQDFWERLR